MQKHKIILFIGSIVLVILAFFCADKQIYVYVQGSYYRLTLRFVSLFLAAFLVFYWMIYRWTRKHLFSAFLSWTHILLTVIFCILIVASQLSTIIVEDSLSDSPILAKREFKFRDFLGTISILLFTSQTFYLINLIGGIIKRDKRKA